MERKCELYVKRDRIRVKKTATELVKRKNRRREREREKKSLFIKLLSDKIKFWKTQRYRGVVFLFEALFKGVLPFNCSNVMFSITFRLQTNKSIVFKIGSFIFLKC
jgi:hypothetical protein